MNTDFPGDLDITGYGHCNPIYLKGKAIVTFILFPGGHDMNANINIVRTVKNKVCIDMICLLAIRTVVPFEEAMTTEVSKGTTDR